MLAYCSADRMRLHGVVPLRLELLVAACIVTDPALRPASGDIISELRAIAETLRPLVDCNGCITTLEAQAAVTNLPLPVWHAAAEVMQDVQVMAREVVSLRCHRLSLQEHVERMQAADAAGQAEAEARAKRWPGNGLVSALDQDIVNKPLAGGCGADGMDCAAPGASHAEAALDTRSGVAGACNALGDGSEVAPAADPSAGVEERGTVLDANHGLSNTANDDRGSDERLRANYEALGGEGNSADTAQISQQLPGVRASHASTRHNASCSRAVFLEHVPLASAIQHAAVSCLLLHFHPAEQRLHLYESHRATACSHAPRADIHSGGYAGAGRAGRDVEPEAEADGQTITLAQSVCAAQPSRTPPANGPSSSPSRAPPQGDVVVPALVAAAVGQCEAGAGAGTMLDSAHNGPPQLRARSSRADTAGRAAMNMAAGASPCKRKRS